MGKFSFTDFLIFSGATSVTEDMYLTVAKGILRYVKEQYGIYPETETIYRKVFFATGQTSLIPPYAPICEVSRVTYDDDIVDSDTYTYYGEDILFDVAFSDTRKPVTLELLVGFGTDGIPGDLKLAIYRHILAAYYALDKHTDNVSQVVNSGGNSTKFLMNSIPAFSRATYVYYAGANMVLS